MSVDFITLSPSEQQSEIDGPCGVPITSFTTKFGLSIPERLETLMSHTIITTKDVSELASDYIAITPDKKQLEEVIDALQKLNALSSGSLLLNKLNELLENKGQKLVFSFVREKQASPICKQLYITICDKDGTTKRLLCPSFIRLPEQLPFAIKLPFFSKNQKKIIYVDEPIHIVIAHELIHCIQNLFYEKVSANILDEFRTNYPTIECLQRENSELFEWCMNFFGGTERTTWPDELQAMVLGFRFDTNYVSESQLLSELLQEGVCSHELAEYKNDVLIPFGHLDPGSKPKDNDALNFTTLLSQTGLPLFAGISPIARLEIKKGLSCILL